jgi:hypothetical protein
MPNYCTYNYTLINFLTAFILISNNISVNIKRNYLNTAIIGPLDNVKWIRSAMEWCNLKLQIDEMASRYGW